MKRKRAVADTHQTWRAAAQLLDDAIGIELRGGERSAGAEVMDIRRFREALLTEREARLRYVEALRADNRLVPDELIWDLSDADNP